MNFLAGNNVVSYLRVFVAAASLVVSLADTPHYVAQPDLYIMAMSHQPEFCYQHQKEGWEGCQHPRDYWKTHLTIHGLWPEVSISSMYCTCCEEQLVYLIYSHLMLVLVHTCATLVWRRDVAKYLYEGTLEQSSYSRAKGRTWHVLAQCEGTRLRSRTWWVLETRMEQTWYL